MNNNKKLYTEKEIADLLVSWGISDAIPIDDGLSCNPIVSFNGGTFTIGQQSYTKKFFLFKNRPSNNHSILNDVSYACNEEISKIRNAIGNCYVLTEKSFKKIFNAEFEIQTLAENDLKSQIEERNNIINSAIDSGAKLIEGYDKNQIAYVASHGPFKLRLDVGSNKLVTKVIVSLDNNILPYSFVDAISFYKNVVAHWTL